MGLNLTQAAAAVAAVAAGVAGAGYLFRLGVRAFRRILTVADVILGSETDGKPSLEARLSGMDRRLTSIEHELHPNSGLSLRDSVDRIELVLTDHLKGAER